MQNRGENNHSFDIIIAELNLFELIGQATLR